MIDEDDVQFHEPGSTDRWWTETAWFSFFVSERSLSGTIYAWFRPNLRIAASCVALWDDLGSDPWDVLHHDYQWQLPMPDARDFRSFQLRSGLELSAVVPLQRWDLRYDNRAGVRFELTCEGVAPAHPVGSKEMGDAGAGHLDQAVRVQGLLEVADEHIDIDCVAIRDRSWGRRSDWVKGKYRRGYTAGWAAGEGFHVMSRLLDGDVDEVVAGYLWRDGVLTTLVAGTREVERVDGRPVRVLVNAQDELGRRLSAVGDCVNRFRWFVRPPTIAWMSLTRWRIGDHSGWGEDQDIWALPSWRDASRQSLGWR